MRNIKEVNEDATISEEFNFMNELDKKFQELGWEDTTEAYYGLDYTPFMSTIEELIENNKLK